MAGTSLGIDIGASFIKIFADGNGSQAPLEDYFPHHGDPLTALGKRFEKMKSVPVSAAVTGSGAGLLTGPLNMDPVHAVQAEIRAVTERFADVRNIINIGAGSSTLIRLDEAGGFRDYATNSLCAAGTGSFLDEQAARLGVRYSNMNQMEWIADPPSIASRCAVFAKSDLIHRQQEGFSKQAMWAGLCKGCVDTFLQTLLKGKPLTGLTVVTGGVTKNPLVMRWLDTYYGDQIRTWSGAHLSGAIGAAGMTARVKVEPDELRRLLGKGNGVKAKSESRGKPLVLKKTTYPSFDVAEEWTDDAGNEVRVWQTPDQTKVNVTLGIDIGSTSTKLICLDESQQVLLDIYRKTLGDPLDAVRRLFTAIEEYEEKTGVKLNVTGCGTTGSGRKFIGQIVGADRIINEISAHVAGAMETDPDIDTIFEIGGQDSKYMRTVGGRIRDANMNFICAAGTGSFVEEQAKKLGFEVAEIGGKVMGVAPPQTSDRCTVFMEQDVNRLLGQGMSRTEVMAGMLNSVVKNYLNKVVGNRPVSGTKVFFQGATARNMGLVAAFENLLDVEVVVSPLCHQMGSYGVALLTARQLKETDEASGFRGFGLSRRKVELRTETCESCNNNCSITFAAIEGEQQEPSWGYMCGKEPGSKKRKANKAYRLFRLREKLFTKLYKSQDVAEDAPVLHLPASLTTHSMLPFWTGMASGLGMRLTLSGPTDEIVKAEGVQNSSGDFCFPVKTALGHALKLAKSNPGGHMLLPHIISAERNSHTTNSLFCPYVQSMPAIVRSAMAVKGLSTDDLLMPVVDLRWTDKQMTQELTKSLGTPLGIGKKQIKKALAHAMAAQKEFEEGCRTEGKKALKALEDKGEKGIIIAGRPYNCFDPGANINLPEKMSEYGTTVIPIDFLDFKPEELGEEYQNIYWSYGQRIVHAALTAAKNPNLFYVYLTNFNCGPDSFLLTYAEKAMGEKPLLILELDEHGADAGYLTRVEAFGDVVNSYEGESQQTRRAKATSWTKADFKNRTLWIPPMHPHTGRIAEGVFDRFGYKAKALPPEDRDAFEIGRKAVRGSECLPACVTIGGFLKKMREIDADPKEHAFFMATANGPCRFGQYAQLHRLILEENGYGDIPILSPTSTNSYQGLDEKMRKVLWEAFVAADMLMKMENRTRPYEVHKGETNRVVEKAILSLRAAFHSGNGLDTAMKNIAYEMNAIEKTSEKKPLVGVVGEIYVRSNPFSNQDVIGHIEKFGGEAWLVPLSEWFLYTTYLQKWRAKEGMSTLAERGVSLLKNRYMNSVEHNYHSWCAPVLDRRGEPPIEDVVQAGAEFLPVNFEGEAIITLGRAIHFQKQGASLVVNCAPFGCMPGTLTSAIFQQLEEKLGMPMVGMYYDGDGDINRSLEVYLREAAGRMNN